MAKNYLSANRRLELKQKFSLDGNAYDYWSDYEGSIRLTFQDLCNIHDFLVFMGTEDYNLWMKSQLKKE